MGKPAISGYKNFEIHLVTGQKEVSNEKHPWQKRPRAEGLQTREAFSAHEKLPGGLELENVLRTDSLEVG